MTAPGPSGATRVLVATRPVDFRKGMDSLAALVTARLGGDPFSGVVYVFRAKKADRVKLVWWDGTGLCLMAKKLEAGAFSWPSVHDGVMRLRRWRNVNTNVASSPAVFWQIWRTNCRQFRKPRRT